MIESSGIFEVHAMFPNQAFAEYFQPANEIFLSIIQPYEPATRALLKTTASEVASNPLQLCAVLFLVSVLAAVCQTVTKRFLHL
jgi:hypothetical protein